MFDVFKDLFNRSTKKELARLKKTVEKINGLEPKMKQLDDTAVLEKTKNFKESIACGTTLEDILPEAFALVREASLRITGRRHYDVQLMGGIVLHEGKIAEMCTGEGKTLVAALPAYLNALSGKPVHIVTVNDYLACRDAEDIGRIYKALGMTVGVIRAGMQPDERRKVYACDIVYGTNHEFGFDYLRDNMVYQTQDIVQRGLGFCIIDEIDSVLIDEARMPLIISGGFGNSSDLYKKYADIAMKMQENVDYEADTKTGQAVITDKGFKFAEKELSNPEAFTGSNSSENIHLLYAAVKAKVMECDKDYVVENGSVIVLDKFTGRLMYGRRFSEGIHQAIEAKEHLELNAETITYASISFQNFFGKYKKLSGMTGTAKTEEQEFLDIYNLPVVTVPTNHPCIRIEDTDIFFRNKMAKYKAVAEKVKELHAIGQPVLIGTASIEESERISELLKSLAIPHTLLNAKKHKSEAEIIALAGQKGAVTVATDMAGRGTDIVLGEGVKELGGLYVIGTERHSSRRIDNQLKGRCARQGDPGHAVFYLSAEDFVIKEFGSNIGTIMDTLGFDADSSVRSDKLAEAVTKAQTKIEERDFNARKTMLGFDDVMNIQREIIYSERKKVLTDGFTRKQFDVFVQKLIDKTFDVYVENDVYAEDRDYKNFSGCLMWLFGIDDRLTAAALENAAEEYPDNTDMLKEYVVKVVKELYDAREAKAGSGKIRKGEQLAFIKFLDDNWAEHLTNMNYLRKSILFRGYIGKDPVQEYKLEAYVVFEELQLTVIRQFVEYMYHVKI